MTPQQQLTLGRAEPETALVHWREVRHHYINVCNFVLAAKVNLEPIVFHFSKCISQGDEPIFYDANLFFSSSFASQGKTMPDVAVISDLLASLSGFDVHVFR